MTHRNKLFALLAAGALAVPSAALATPGNGHGHSGEHGHAGSHGNPVVTYVFKGTYNGDGSVHVTAGNSRVRKGGYVNEDVSFDLSAARITAADTNGDGTVDATDVAGGDKVVVKARLPKKDAGEQPFAAKHLVDQTHPAG